MNEFSSNLLAMPTATVICEHEYDTPEQTAVVVGLAQGGTSMVAAVVDALGVPLVDVPGQMFNFESTDRPFCAEDFETWCSKIPGLNDRYVAWGLKDTLISRFAPVWVNAALRNPYYLVASRDVVATAQRRGKPGGLLQLKETLLDHQDLWRWVLSLPPAPVLIVSYERAIANREQFVATVADFLKTPCTTDQLARAVERISPTGGYLIGEDSVCPGTA